MNRLRDANIHCRRAASKEGLTEGKVVDRLAFAIGWRNFDWGSVIFSDETSISSDCESRGHVYREPGTRYDTLYIQRRERSARFSVSCWGWISRAGVGMLECIHGRFKAPQYVHILENVMIPSVRVRNPKGNLILQQDNHPCTAAWTFEDGSRSGRDRTNTLVSQVTWFQCYRIHVG